MTQFLYLNGVRKVDRKERAAGTGKRNSKEANTIGENPA